jgi:hypothetical protein
MRSRFNPGLCAAAALAAALLAPSAAQASTISFGSCSGSTCTNSFTGGTFTLTPSGGNFEQKTFNGVTGLGVSGGTAGEIDVNESISGTFSTDITLDDFKLLFIYNGPEFGDPFEVAQVTINGTTSQTLTITGENSGVWSGGLPTTVTGCAADPLHNTTSDGPGCFLVSNPFGSTPIHSISFTALHSGVGFPPITNDSDYSLGQLDVTALRAGTTDFTPVPEPASLLLLGTGLLAAARGRRRANP